MIPRFIKNCLLLLSLLPIRFFGSGGGGGTPEHTTSTNTIINQPWSEVIPYLKDLYGRTDDFASQYEDLTKQQQGLYDQQYNTLNNMSGQLRNNYGYQSGLASNISQGGFSTHYGAVPYIGMDQMPLARYVQSQYSDPSVVGDAMLDMGALDPTRSYQQLLSGDPTSNPYLRGMNQANINDAMRGYRDSIDYMNTEIMPGIENEAFAAGGYGGSRQGVAEGLALQQAQRNARDLGIAAMDSGNELYGRAFEGAQNRMAGSADTLFGGGLQNEQFNSANILQNNQFNAQNALQNEQFNKGNVYDALKFNRDLSLQNRDFAYQQDLQNLQTRLGGVGLQNALSTDYMNNLNTRYGQMQNVLDQPYQRDSDIINQLASIFYPGAGLGGSQSSTTQQPVYSNTLGQIGGLLTGIAGLGSLYGGGYGGY